MTDDPSRPLPKQTTREETYKLMEGLDPVLSQAYRLTPCVPFSPDIFKGSILVLDDYYDPTSYDSVRGWALALMNLDRKSQAGNSSILTAAYVNGCWVDSKAVIAGDLALNRLLRAGIRLNHKRVTYRAQPLQMQTDSSSQSVSLGGGSS